MNRLIQKLKEGASKASEKAQNVMEINRIQAQITARRKEIESNIYNIGELVYDAYKKNDLTIAESDIMEIGKANLALEEEIKQLEWKTSELRHEKRCECGEIAPITAKFCSSCGSKLPEPPAPLLEEDEEQEELIIQMKKPSFVEVEDDERYEPFYSQEKAYQAPDFDVYEDEPERYTYKSSHPPQPNAEKPHSADMVKPMYEEAHKKRDLNVTVGGRRLPIGPDGELSIRRCPNCNSYADVEAKWCERCGTPFV
ncbi:zinc ribbon domain-containing protein [Paenibacillus sp. MER TA 81-3]|uniref:zinc ribbon domain-containing protein n=1 Tax=Paenibacillus sp. MER TA 81-3 TaxID=2939573 RepID=UPI00203B26A1|nr:zinc ribbon domain-containing protein [Paenibacillus sp. MER TA 81-3]MCM3339166.1 zinc ribbon domain-containing protein [Paenibacillus sp. MER TA 81-3]